jgi:uncharacterized repeat protein (TIGR01451 family)
MEPSWWRRFFARTSLPRRRRPWLVFEALEDRLTPAMHTWTGLGESPSWSDTGNWANGSAPAAGESNVVLNFGPAANESTSDDIPGLTVQQINLTAGGYSLAGNLYLTLAGGISDQSTTGANNNISLNMTFATAETVQVATPARDLLLSGTLIGPGSLTKTGAGALDLTAPVGGEVPMSGQPNGYAGPTQVNQGVLKLNKFQALIGSLIVGDGVGGPNADQVFLLADGATAPNVPVTITSSGELIVGDAGSLTVTDGIGSLDMTGGEVLGTNAPSGSSGTSLLVLGGGVTTHAAATTARIDANLDLGGATRTFNIAGGGADPGLIVTGVISSTATASSGPSGPTLPTADLSVTKTGPTSAGAGGLITYTITVENFGPVDAPSTTFTDVVPSGTTFSSVTQQGGPTFNCATPSAGGTGSVVCSTADLAPFQPATFLLAVQVNPAAADGSTVTNTATVSSSVTDPNPGNNSATATTTISAQADLWVSLPNPPQQATGGLPATYTISVTNLGPASAQSVSLSDSFPGATFDSLSQTAGPTFTCTPPGPSTPTTATCTIPLLASGGAATFQLVVTPNGGPSPQTDTATVTSINPDPNPVNNNATVTAFSQADLAVTQTPPPVVTAGTDITYTIAVTNNGPDNAQNVSLTDMVPADEVNPVEMQTGGPTFTCFGSGTGFSCFANDLASGQTATFVLQAHVNSSAADGENLANVASVGSDNDTITTNNTSTANTTVTTEADVGITKTGPSVIGRGATVTYNLFITNNGPSDAQFVMVTDQLPPQTTFVNAFGAGFTCTGPSAAGGPVTCTDNTLAAGQSADITVEATVSPQAANNTVLTDAAQVTADTADNNPQNNSSSFSTTVVPTADLAVTKTGPSSAAPGSDITYALSATNSGPDDAQSVSLTDNVPSGTTFVSLAETGGTTTFGCSGPGSTGTLTCTAATLPNGHFATFQLVVQVAPTAPSGSSSSGVFNTASVSSTTNDPNTENNSASVFTSVIYPNGAGLTKTGAGTLVLAGNNTYTGPTTVDAGTLLVDGSQPASVAVVNGGTLGGRGTLGATTVNPGGTLSPEDSDQGAPSSLTVHGNLTLSPGATFLSFLDGTAPGLASLLNVTGTVNLNNATLDVRFGFNPGAHHPLTIIANLGPQPVVGTFRGIPEQGLTMSGGRCFVVSYRGGNGNDVVVTGIDNNELFVRAVYTALGLFPIYQARGIDPQKDITKYVNQLDAGLGRDQVVAEIWTSAFNRAAEVASFYAEANFTPPNNRLTQTLINDFLVKNQPEWQVFEEFLSSRAFNRAHHKNRDYVRAVYEALLHRRPTRAEMAAGVALASQGSAGRAALVDGLLSANKVYDQAVLNSFLFLFGRRPSPFEVAVFVGQMKTANLSSESFFVNLTTSPTYTGAFLAHFKADCMFLTTAP